MIAPLDFDAIVAYYAVALDITTNLKC